MAKIGLFYGTQTGNTETIANTIKEAFGGDKVDLHDVADVEVSQFDEYEYLIIGCPTWNVGEMQSDWEALYEDLDDINFSGKTIAYFGAGDQIGYAENFQDAMGLLAEKITSLGGKTVGQTSTDGYEFEKSQAVVDGKFVGLALDEDNQSEMTNDRIQAWVSQLKSEFSI